VSREPEIDTIAAVATAPGRGALAIVRISGPGTLRILGDIVPGASVRSLSERRPEPRVIVDPASGEKLDRGLVTWFPGPASYTGEDSAEISVHGGLLVPGLVLAACVGAGARMARAGEFTQRAFLNGKLDLIQAEGVHDLIEADSEARRRAALTQVEGGLSRRLARLREGIVELEALLVYHLDFPEEDEPPVPVSTIILKGRELAEALGSLVGTAPEGELLRDGALVVLAGRPNSGKSSLFNALLGEKRAIVTSEPGTTRDAIEARISLSGFPFRVMDTAGIRDAPGEVERMGIEVARRYVDRAQVVLLCIRADEGLGAVERDFIRTIPESVVVVPVHTMVDLAAEREDRGRMNEEIGWIGTSFEVSVLEGLGLKGLKEGLPELIFPTLIDAAELPVLTRRRQAQAVRLAGREVTEFVEALEGHIPAEVAATHLRAAESALEELLGVLEDDEVLDRVFGEFCIGK
jgi:tRNA modification GTPase